MHVAVNSVIPSYLYVLDYKNKSTSGCSQLSHATFRSAKVVTPPSVFTQRVAVCAHTLQNHTHLSCTRARRAPTKVACAANIHTVGGDKTTKFLFGILWFFAHQLIGVGNDVIMKYTGSTLGVAQVVFLRFAFATLTMLPVMIVSGMNSFKTERVHLHVARSFLLATGIALYCQGLAIAPIAVVTTLNFTIPLFTLVMARVFIKEKVDAIRWISTIVGFSGVVIVVQPGGSGFDPMWLCVLLSAAMFAALDVLNKVFVGKESFWSMIFYTALFTSLIATIPALLSWVAPTGFQLCLLAILGAGANLLLFCLLKSFSLLDASALAPFRYTELMWSAAVGAWIFGEIPTMATLVGAAVIIPSTLYVVWAENEKTK
jgi:S-adenosylmethionine uptake transporter|uniref:EamA domain-containing protein n=1 Tax=Micromonas pusilla TaxID=38833 RepID=A0A7R9TDQ8_MICPS|mmetsp:Transcript_14058/g.50481  ORF Transcript_14058/g.50481 Transcript_14058/m.50481 type:complete len:373 (+) Transcript_14058:124-1242(+)